MYVIHHLAVFPTFSLYNLFPYVLSLNFLSTCSLYILLASSFFITSCTPLCISSWLFLLNPHAISSPCLLHLLPLRILAGNSSCYDKKIVFPLQALTRTGQTEWHPQLMKHSTKKGGSHRGLPVLISGPYSPFRDPLVTLFPPRNVVCTTPRYPFPLISLFLSPISPPEVMHADTHVPTLPLTRAQTHCTEPQNHSCRERPSKNYEQSSFPPSLHSKNVFSRVQK